VTNLMDTMTYGLAARRKLGAVPPDFHVFRAEWIGATPEDWKTMRVTGAQFCGRRRLPGTTMSVIVTREEMTACSIRPSVLSEPKPRLMMVERLRAKPMSFRQREMLKQVTDEWSDLPVGVGCTNGTLEALERRGLVETQIEPGKQLAYSGGWQWRKKPNAAA
jgi:hypothetical protein